MLSTPIAHETSLRVVSSDLTLTANHRALPPLCLMWPWMPNQMGTAVFGSDIFILDIDYEIDDLLPHSKTWLPAAASALILL